MNKHVSSPGLNVSGRCLSVMIIKLQKHDACSTSKFQAMDIGLYTDIPYTPLPVMK